MNIYMLGNGNIRSKNFNASFLINDNILVDTPGGTLKELAKTNKNLDDIKIIIITHLHGDHTFDLPFIIQSEKIRKREGKLIIIGPKNLKKYLAKLTMLAFNNPLEKYINSLDITFLDSQSVQNNEIAEGMYLSSVSVKHGPMKDCYGFILKSNDKKLGFTGDAAMCPGLTYMVKQVNYCIIDVAEDSSNTHLKFKEFKQLASDTEVKYIPVHFPDELEKDLMQIQNVKIIKPHEQFYI